VPEPSAGEIVAADYPDLAGEPVIPESNQTVAATILPQFEPLPGEPLDPRSVEIPPESPGRPPWEARAR
jgi:hypothetical protein